ncbi:MAG: MarR family winged helix-turn-helix transcriptional regulator [Deltaproteobacteria bacterium]
MPRSPRSGEPAGGSAPGRSGTAAPSAGDLLLRTADCLTALLQTPTAQAGLNESRYNVLDALRRKATGTCSQTELAAHLLQSESNLSTLLERMRQDGLISRVRSESDRRVALIGLSIAGREALARADGARHRAAAAVLEVLDKQQEVLLCEALGLLLDKLERRLGIAGRWTTDMDSAGASRHPTGNLSPARGGRSGGRAPAQIHAATANGATP